MRKITLLIAGLSPAQLKRKNHGIRKPADVKLKFGFKKYFVLDKYKFRPVNIPADFSIGILSA